VRERASALTTERTRECAAATDVES